MTDSLAAVRAHYGATDLTTRLEAALAALGPNHERLSPQQLSGLDQFHSRGVAATSEIGALAGLSADMAVLDVGSGVGGPARFLSATYGCRVTGVDLSEAFVEASRYLTKRTGQEDKVTFQQGNALDLPFSDGRFDASLLLHVAMNIGDRARLYHEIRRVLRRGGKLAVFDVVQNGGEPHYPVPWARTPETSYLLTAEETRKAIEGAQFQTVGCRDDTDAVKAWSRQLSTSGPPPAPNLGLIMGPDFPVLAANLGRNFLEDRLGVLTAIFQAA